MRVLNIYGHIIDVAKKQLLASIPKKYSALAKERLYFTNISRFSIQSTVLALMDIGVLIAYLLNRADEALSFYFIGLLAAKILFNLLCSFAFAHLSNKPYRPHSWLHRTVDILYPLLYAISEFAFFILSPQHFGILIRLFAVPYIVGGIPVIKQLKSFILLLAVYVSIYLCILQTEYAALFASYSTPFSFWAVVFPSGIFVSATVYSWFVNNFIATAQAEWASEELEHMNGQLSNEVQQRTRLLNVVNEISTVLLSSDTANFGSVLFASMAKIGAVVDVDRVYIWKNHMQGDELYCTQMHEWSGGAEPQQGNELTVSVLFPEDWYPNLSVNECVNGIVSEFPKREREHLQAQDIMSILVVPVYIYNEFWGFVGFDDCRNERRFSNVEESVLRMISLLFANSLLRNEMTEQLMSATEEALASSKAKTEFLANMSHEIRTPINAITGMSSLARMADDKEAVHNCLDRIDAASRQLLSIINDVLDMSKIEAGKIELAEEPFELLQVLHNVQSIIGVQAGEKKLELKTDFASDLPAVLIGDDTRLSQILINLLSNAVKFTPEGGRVNFSAARLQSLPDGTDELQFTIADTGIGIAPEQQQKLFGMFEQADRGTSRRFGGTGLGLAITKSLVSMMNGDIEVRSALGVGSCFIAVLRIRRGEAGMVGPGDVAEQLQEYDFSSYRALLVEDIAINREIVLAMLESTGLQIDEAEDGRLALDMVRAAPDRYDIIFMDLHMPEMDGYSATQQIRALDHPKARSVPIIAMTANAFSEDIKQCLAVGMNDHVAKPIDFDELISKINRYLTERQVP